jgi:predicted TIM-barrel fold metal-dependent hydrolase
MKANAVRAGALAAGCAFALALPCAGAPAPAPAPPSSTDDTPYRTDDFTRVLKIDVHVHLHGDPTAFVARLHADGFRVLTINVDYPDFPALATQRAHAIALAAAHPADIAWAASFPVAGIDDPAWSARTIADLDAARTLGAVAVKVWKNIGMSAKDRDGRYLMLDDPRLDAVFDHLAAEGVVVLGHQGEPLNCWLPLAQMTIAGDRQYFAEHPEYHGLLHPEVPGRDAQLAARDARLRRTPGLRFVALHLASLEADVDELAAFLDRFPQASVDLAARLVHLELQSVHGRDRVRDFLVRYQDRVLYGTDLTQEPSDRGTAFAREADATWRDDWRFLATDAAMRSPEFPGAFRGLALPRGVVDKIYRLNALRVLGPRAWAGAAEARVTMSTSPPTP